MQTETRHRRRRRKRSRFKLWLLLIILVFGMFIAYPFWEAKQLTVDEHILQVTNLPQNLKNLEIIFASDFHHSGKMEGSRTEDVITRINNLSADLVILGGDYASGTEEAIDFFTNLPNIWARMGIYAVLGDMEYTNPERVNELIGVMTGRNIIPLVNTYASVKVGQNHLIVAGIDSNSSSEASVNAIASSVNEDEFVIVVSHTPDVVTQMQKSHSASGSSHWYDLALFGHTHGGQVNLFGFTPFSSFRLSNAGSRYLQGWLEESRANLLTSNGIGTEYLPIRFRAKPQIHVIKLKSR